jgi:hypothetical protein
MPFSLEVLRAKKGDCLIVHYGDAGDERLMLIDGGPSGVYGPHLRPRLEQLRSERAQDEQDPLPIDVLMISHVDDDHIQGILELTRELRVQKEARQPPLVKVGSLWHNSFDELVGTTPKQLTASVQFGEAALSGRVDLESVDDFDVASVLASIPQGHKLREDAQFLRWKVNKELGGKLVMAGKGSKAVTLDGGLALTLIGPLQPELAALQKAHDKWLDEREKRARTKAESALAAFVDRSIPNLSSIVALARSGERTMLLTGDARGDKILKGLRAARLLDGGDGSLHVDILKMPHHGSANNMETVFLEQVTADHYVFSGDGEHGNPERETLEMLFEARGGDEFEMHFTYPLDEVDAERKKDWEKEQAKERKRGKGDVRENWSRARHALAPFLTPARLGRKRRLRFVDEEKPHQVDL